MVHNNYNLQVMPQADIDLMRKTAGKLLAASNALDRKENGKVKSTKGTSESNNTGKVKTITIRYK